MNPIDLTLLAISSAEKPLEPVQLQKSLFLLAAKTPTEWLSRESRYQFQPYDYGPFSAAIYSDAEQLEKDGYVEIRRPPSCRYKQYTITDRGRTRASELSISEQPQVAIYLKELVNYTQSLDFNRLVASVYEEFPDMKEKSVFKDIR